MGAFSNTAKNKILDAVGNAASIGLSGAIFAKLHTGDPGSAGTSNAATNTSRQAVSVAAASGGAILSDAEVRWDSVPADETYSWVSFWDADPAGVFLGSDDLPVARAVLTGDSFFVASGDITLSL